MKKITLHFDGITQQRKFESSLQFLGIPYEENDSDHTVTINNSDIPARYKVEVSSGPTGSAITYRKDEAA